MTALYGSFKDVIDRASIEQIAQLLQLATTRRGDQLRCRCPVHGGDERSLAITPTKAHRGNGSMGVFFCQPSESGGDRIGLVSHVLNCTQSEAVQHIEKHFGNKAAIAATVPTVPRAVDGKEDADRLRKVAAALLPVHEEVQKLGIEPEAAQDWGIGWKATGTMVQRVLFPLRDQEGAVRGYCGLSETKQPRWMLPNNIDPASFIFGADRIEPGDLCIVSDPLKVVLRHQHGVQAVCFLTEVVGSLQVEMLASLMDQKKCELVF